MKVYAEYFIKNGLQFRKNTLLQFGSSWELIGNVVLANPGSAQPAMPVADNALSQISNFFQEFRRDESIQDNYWFQFSADSTMDMVEKIFNGWYLGYDRKLNGVVQLFNTFNIKNQNLTEAIDQIGVKSDPLLFSHTVYKYFGDRPTYFGFSKQVLEDPILREVAKYIFDNSSEKIRSPYKKSFSDNYFYHPMYINRAFRQRHFQQYKNEILSAMVACP